MRKKIYFFNFTQKVKRKNNLIILRVLTLLVWIVIPPVVLCVRVLVVVHHIRRSIRVSIMSIRIPKL